MTELFGALAFAVGCLGMLFLSFSIKVGISILTAICDICNGCNKDKVND